MRVPTDCPLDVALDGEATDNLPGEFEVAGQARVDGPPECEESDD